MSGVAFEVISPTPRAFSEEIGKGKKGLPERDSSHFVLTASYLNKCIKKKPTSASLSIYFTSGERKRVKIIFMLVENANE